MCLGQYQSSTGFVKRAWRNHSRNSNSCFVFRSICAELPWTIPFNTFHKLPKIVLQFYRWKPVQQLVQGHMCCKRQS